MQDIPIITEEAQPPINEELFDYAKASSYIKQLISSWSAEVEATKKRRDERYIDIDVEELRSKGEIQADETFIPVRVIDTNIVREQPPYIAFLTQSRRLVYFKCVTDPSMDCEKLSLEVTDGMRYNGWLTPWHRVVDGHQTHGWDAVEVVFDASKPLHVGIEHIGHDKLFFNKNVENIQDSEHVVRAYKVTATKLEEFVRDYGFDKVQVDIILAKNATNATKMNQIYDVYKVYFKVDGGVFVAWFTDKYGTRDWLKAPMPLYLGINDTDLMGGTQPVQLDMYPIFLLTYKENEEEEITRKVGRCFLDGDWQEAHTAIVTGYVNGVSRASGVYAAIEDSADDPGGSMRQLDVTLQNNAIYDRKLNFFNPPYPEPAILSGLGYLTSLNSQQTGQVDYATNNRKDSRKTATEVESAQQEAALLKGIPIKQFSEFFRDVMTFAWQIIQSQAQQNKIPLLGVPQVMVDPFTGEQAVVYINDPKKLGHEYEIFPAGDDDVIKRAEKIASMMQDWPVVQGTPLALPFLADLMKLKYPEKGEEYAQILTTQDPLKTLVQQLAITLQGALQPEEVMALNPQEQQQLNMIQQQLAQLGINVDLMKGNNQNVTSPSIQQGSQAPV